MTNEYYLSVERRYSKAIIRVAARHNTREDYTVAGVSSESGIDPTCIKNNIRLRGPDNANDIASQAKTLMDDAGIGNLRKDAVTMLEVLFSLPTDSAIDSPRYFEACTAWAEEHFKVPVLSSIIHLDESAPHCHVLLLPLIDGHMVGSDLFGRRTTLDDRQEEFFQKVAKHFGLPRQAPKKRYSAAFCKEVINRARIILRANSGLTDALIESLILKPHAKNPEPLMNDLNIVMPEREAETVKKYVKILTSEVLPEKLKPNGFVKAKPNGFHNAPVDVIEQTRTWDGFHNPPPSFLPPAAEPTIAPKVEQQADDNAGDWTRERENDIPADWWHDGEPHKMPARTSARHQADELVNVALRVRKASKGAAAGAI